MTKNEIKELYKKKYRRDTTTVRVPPAVYDYLTTYASHMQVTIRTAIVHAYNEFAHVCKTDDGAARDSLYKIVGGRNVGICKNIAVPNNVYCVLRDLADKFNTTQGNILAVLALHLDVPKDAIPRKRIERQIFGWHRKEDLS